jgi:hypothetical protein
LKKKNKVKLLPDDSASDITYLEVQERLAKYTDENITTGKYTENIYPRFLPFWKGLI